MRRKKFHFNPQTLTYEPVVYTPWQKLRRTLLYILSSAFGGAIFFLLFFSLVSSPREKQLLQERNRIRVQYGLLDKEVEQMERVLADLQQRDDNLYRVIFQAEPISPSIRSGANNKAQYYEELAQMSNSQVVADVTRKVDMLEKQMYVQSKSYDEIVQLVKNNKVRLENIPAIQPVLNKDLTRMASGYGKRIDPVYHTMRMHEGMDFTAPVGTDVYATGNAVVREAGWKSGYGNCIDLDHGFGYTTRYGHLSKILVRPGQKVKRGDVVGLVGNTGKSTGPHLHYEVRFRGQAVNPQNFYFQDLSPDEYDRMVQMANNAGQMLD